VVLFQLGIWCFWFSRVLPETFWLCVAATAGMHRPLNKTSGRALVRSFRLIVFWAYHLHMLHIWCIYVLYIYIYMVFFKAYIWDIWGVNVARYSILEHCSIWDPFVGVVAILSPTISVTNKNCQCMNVHRKIIWTFALKYLEIADFLSTSWNVHNWHFGELRTSLHYPCVDHDLLWIGPHWDKQLTVVLLVFQWVQ
jgi:hypothetical protein